MVSKSTARQILFIAVAFLLGTSGFAQSRIVSKFGKTQVQGRETIVHVWVLVPPGVDENAAADAALANQGARPFQPAEFETSGLVWDQFSDSDSGNDTVTQSYNATGDPTGDGGAALLSSQSTWTGVVASKFAFASGGETTRCPSLVRECPGPQSYDGYNDVAWVGLGGCCTLGVTWYGTSVDEADMALNTKFSWDTLGGDFDVETVFLHENGHVLGLGHSEEQKAVMYASYQELHRDLHQDDVDGVIFLYPADATIGSISGTVTNTAQNLLVGASVVVEDTTLSATTDDTGYYFIEVGEGTYDVTASASGYISQTEAGVLVSGGVNTDVHFTLNAAPEGSSDNVFVPADGITYATEGGRNKDKHLIISVALVDDSSRPVAGATVSIELYRDSSFVGSGSGTTGSDGVASFNLKNAESGCYSTEVTKVIADGLTWNAVTPSNNYCK